MTSLIFTRAIHFALGALTRQVFPEVLFWSNRTHGVLRLVSIIRDRKSTTRLNFWSNRTHGVLRLAIRLFAPWGRSMPFDLIVLMEYCDRWNIGYCVPIARNFWSNRTHGEQEVLSSKSLVLSRGFSLVLRTMVEWLCKMDSASSAEWLMVVIWDFGASMVRLQVTTKHLAGIWGCSEWFVLKNQVMMNGPSMSKSLLPSTSQTLGDVVNN